MRLKQVLVLLGTTASISLISLSNVSAQDSSEYLKQIAANTLNTANKVNNLPELLQSIGDSMSTLTIAWTSPIDPSKSPSTSKIQESMTKLNDLITQSQANQQGVLGQLNNDLLSNNGENVNNANAGTKLIKAPLPAYANDLTYSTLLGVLPYGNDDRTKNQPPTDPAYNYIKNASGLNLYHRRPQGNWPASDNKNRYQAYYNTVMAVESFSAYALSNPYVEGNQLNTLQATLVKQATDASWVAEVLSEKIGFVLRQILLYQSQTFVLMTQLVQTQKQMVAAQAMTNATLIAVNSINEKILAADAQGVQPR